MTPTTPEKDHVGEEVRCRNGHEIRVFANGQIGCRERYLNSKHRDGDSDWIADCDVPLYDSWTLYAMRERIEKMEEDLMKSPERSNTYENFARRLREIREAKP